MKISNIRKQVKLNDRYSIFIDGKYCFSLSLLELQNAKLKINQEINKQTLKQLKKTAVLDKAYSRAIYLIARRPRSVWEIEFYLKQKNFKPTEIIKTIDKLVNNNYLSDESFAEAWVRSRRALKPISKRKLSQELLAKRVDKDIINKVLELDQTQDLYIIKEIINKKRNSARYQDDQKLKQYLIRQGFNYQDIKQAILLLDN